MPRFVYFTASSFNGFIATEDNSLDWLFAVGSAESVDFEGFLVGIDVLVMGSTTYEWVCGHETLSDSPGKWRDAYGSARHSSSAAGTCRCPRESICAW